MTKDLNINEIMQYFRKRALLLFYFGLAGLIVGLVINFFSPKIYESYFEFQLAGVHLKSELNGSAKPIWVITPAAVDARRILMSPMKIDPRIVEACGYSDTNQNRKELINQIYINLLNPAGADMFVNVRIEGAGAAKECAEAIQTVEVSNSNAELGKYLKKLVDSGMASKILDKRMASLSGAVRVSSDPIYPRKILNLLASISLALILGLLIDWVYFGLKLRLQK